ncbi:unnamed protein product [Moneuplotes crassus]|uniref:Uncharacterized protein n=1 Tax=Euplotes crassus TaxID=5936 RepID=A0AAD2CWJ3_EUPCR|nr:unnamed protein product [Moneuplotes crassus]
MNKNEEETKEGDQTQDNRQPQNVEEAQQLDNIPGILQNQEPPIAVQLNAVPDNLDTENGNNEESQEEDDREEDQEAEGEDFVDMDPEDPLGEEGDLEDSSSSEEEKEIEGENITKNGCTHYARNAELYCHQCDKYFPCRFCHDEFWESNFKEVKKFHNFDRFNVQKVKCIECENIQEPQEKCSSCDISFGKYVCLKCNFFDDRGLHKQTFHCDGCGICRIGGRDNYFHCEVCNACLPISLQSGHKCGDFSQDCPICFEGFYNARQGSIILKCGHVLHSKCYREMLKANYLCPICKRSTLNDAQTEHVNGLIQNHIDNTNMGEAGERDVNILCNECHEKSTVKFHIVAHKCPKCGSFNTAMD